MQLQNRAYTVSPLKGYVTNSQPAVIHYKISRMIQWMCFFYSPSSLDLAPLVTLARKSPTMTSNDEFYVSAGEFFLPPLMAENYKLQVPHFKATSKERGRWDLTSQNVNRSPTCFPTHSRVSHSGRQFLFLLFCELNSRVLIQNSYRKEWVWFCKATGAVHSGSCRVFCIMADGKIFFLAFFLWQHNNITKLMRHSSM